MPSQLAQVSLIKNSLALMELNKSAASASLIEQDPIHVSSVSSKFIKYSNTSDSSHNP